MSRFLLDANLSPTTADFLRDRFNFDVAALRDVASGSPTDLEVVALAQRTGRVIITFDTDFGELYHFRERGTLGIIVLELRDQTVESVNRTLGAFFRAGTADIDLESSLVIIQPGMIRVVRNRE